MHYFAYPSKDATIYSKYPTYNYGLDEILEITKEIGSVSTDYWNSRILIQFDTSSFSSAAIASASYFYLNLYAANASELASDYTIEVYPVSKSWDQGTGYSAATNVGYGTPFSRRTKSWEHGTEFSNAGGIHKDGVTWSTRTRTLGWSVSGSDYHINSSSASQSFSFESTDIRMDVTSIVRQWISGTIPNYGFLIKFSNEEESGSLEYGRLTFYSKDTHTVNLPSLEAVWDDSTFVTGSSQLIVSGTITGILSTGGTVTSSLVSASGTISGSLTGDAAANISGYITGTFDGAYLGFITSSLSSSLSQSLNITTTGIYSGSFIGIISGSISGTMGIISGSSTATVITASYFTGSIDGSGSLSGSYSYISTSSLSGSVSGSIISFATTYMYISGNMNLYTSGTLSGSFVGTSSNAYQYYWESGSISGSNSSSGSISGQFDGSMSGVTSTISGSLTGLYTVSGTTLGNTVISGSFTNYLSGITFQALTDDQISIVFKNLKKEYKYGTNARFRIYGKDQYQRKTFLNTAATAFNIIKYLPQNATYYSIVDAYTGRIIIPFDDYSKVSCDTDGNFFDVNLNGFMPERFYRIIFKSTFSGVDNYYDKNYIFKVVR